jgi:hypothetical protein
MCCTIISGSKTWRLWIVRLFKSIHVIMLRSKKLLVLVVWHKINLLIVVLACSTSFNNLIVVHIWSSLLQPMCILFRYYSIFLNCLYIWSFLKVFCQILLFSRPLHILALARLIEKDLRMLLILDSFRFCK